MEISGQRNFLGFEDELQFCLQASPASRVPLPGSDEARAMTAGSGRQCSMLLDVLSPLGAFSKILLESPLFTRSEEFYCVWQVWDTRLDCSAFQLMPLGRITDGSGSLLWRTPNAAIVTGGGQNGEKRLEAGHAMQLSDQVLSPKLWPTPHAADGTGGGSPLRHDPSVTGGRSNLRDAVNPSQASGSLNPRFVEELMGFEIDHTALKRSATPSCRNKRILSSKRSLESKEA